MNHITVEIGLIDPIAIHNMISFDPHETFGGWDGLEIDESGVKVLIDAVSVTGDEIFNALSEVIDMKGFYDTLVVMNKGGDIRVIDSEILTRFGNMVFFAGGEVEISNNTGITRVTISANTAKLNLKHVIGYPERVSVATKCGAKITTDLEFRRPVKVANLTSVSSFAAQCFENAARNKANATAMAKRADDVAEAVAPDVPVAPEVANDNKGTKESKKEVEVTGGSESVTEVTVPDVPVAPEVANDNKGTKESKKEVEVTGGSESVTKTVPAVPAVPKVANNNKGTEESKKEVTKLDETLMYMGAISECILRADISTTTIGDVIGFLAINCNAPEQEVAKLVEKANGAGYTLDLTIREALIKFVMEIAISRNEEIKISNIKKLSDRDFLNQIVPTIRYMAYDNIAKSYREYHNDMVNGKLRDFVKAASGCNQLDDAVNKEISTYLSAIGYIADRNDRKHSICCALQCISEFKLFPRELREDADRVLNELLDKADDKFKKKFKEANEYIDLISSRINNK